MKENKIYSYKGELYSDDYWKDPIHSKYAGSLDMLIDLLTDDDTGLECSCVTVYYLGGEYIGTDDNMGSQEILEMMLDGGYAELEEVKE